MKILPLAAAARKTANHKETRKGGTGRRHLHFPVHHLFPNKCSVDCERRNAGRGGAVTIAVTMIKEGEKGGTRERGGGRRRRKKRKRGEEEENWRNKTQENGINRKNDKTKKKNVTTQIWGGGGGTNNHCWRLFCTSLAKMLNPTACSCSLKLW
jgi:hypothetical protein